MFSQLESDYSYGCIILCENRRISFYQGKRNYILPELHKFATHGCVTWSYINVALNFLNLRKLAQFEMMNRCGLYVSAPNSVCHWRMMLEYTIIPTQQAIIVKVTIILSCFKTMYFYKMMKKSCKDPRFLGKMNSW